MNDSTFHNIGSGVFARPIVTSAAPRFQFINYDNDTVELCAALKTCSMMFILQPTKLFFETHRAAIEYLGVPSLPTRVS